MTFARMADLFAGQTCCVCGSGPTFDSAAAASHDGPRILVNRAVFHVPPRKDDFWLVLDDVWGLGIDGPWHFTLERIRAKQAPTIAVLRDPLLGGRTVNRAPAGAGIIPFNVMRGGEREKALRMSRDKISVCRQLYERIGSSATAMHLAWYLGCQRVRLLGIDGGGEYTTARRYAQVAIDTLGIEVVQ